MNTHAAKIVPPLPTELPIFGGIATAKSASFTVYAVADSVRVRLIHPGTRSLAEHELANPEHPHIWHVTVPGDSRGWTYTYDITRKGRTEAGVLDPHAQLVSEGACVLVEDKTPVAKSPAIDPAEAVIYELHVRDFTNHPTSGVRPAWRGTYLGLGEPGTVVMNGSGAAISTGLDHLKELGVTVVQLMPVHAFAYIHHNLYDWGYMPEIFGAPHAQYASGAALESPVREMKHLVSALHEAGMRVTIDMVFNHTAERWPARRRSLMSLAPKEYFRHDAKGKPADGSGCGNELQSEHPITRDLIVRSCERWVREFGVDGFRFDLMGLIDLETIDQLTHAVTAIKPGAMVYGEPWAAGPSPARVTCKGDQRSRGFAVFNDDFRDAARGHVFETNAPGFLTHGRSVNEIKRAVRGSVETFADSPLESINYLEVHDNHTLADRVALMLPHDDVSVWERVLALGAYLLLTSAGVPLIHSGQEFARTQEMIDNAYDRADAVNNIDWAAKGRDRKSVV